MPNSYVRSLRLEEDLTPSVSTLPPKSVNALVNDLLHLFFSDEQVRAKLINYDSRFSGYRAPLVDFTQQVDQKLPPPASPSKILLSEAGKKAVDQIKDLELSPGPVEKPRESVEKPTEKNYSIMDSILPG